MPNCQGQVLGHSAPSEGSHSAPYGPSAGQGALRNAVLWVGGQEVCGTLREPEVRAAGQEDN